MPGAGLIGAIAPRSRNRRRNGTQAAITAVVVPASVDLVTGQSLSDTTNWAAFLDAANYATTAAGAVIASVVVNFTGSTGDASTPLVAGDVNHFSITVTDSVGTTRDFVVQPRVVAQAAPTAGAALVDRSFVRGTGLETLDVSVDFTGDTLVFGINTVPGVSIDSATGVISVDTDATAVQTGTPIIVTATNTGGAISSGFSLAIKQGVVFPIFGQSNAVGIAPFDNGAVHPENTLQYSQGNILVPAAIPLDHTGEQPGNMGLDVQFAIDYMAANPTHAVIFVPRGTNGSSFVDNDWTAPSGALYADALADINAALATFPLFQLGGFLWHQGEADAVANNPNYGAQLAGMIAAFRANITAASPSTPWVMGGLRPGPGNNFATFSAIIEGVANDLEYTTFADTSDLSDFDELHFDAPSLRLLGSRYYTQFVAAQSDVLVATAPGQVTGLIASPGTTTVSLSWTAPANGGAVITDLQIDYAPCVSSEWTFFYEGAFGSTSATVTGLTNDQPYLFRVSAINAVGTGASSTPLGATPVGTGYLFDNNSDGTVTFVAAGLSPSSAFFDNEDGTVERIS